MKGQPFERLIGRTPDGLPIQPLYRAPDFPSSTDGAGLPGQAPFVRGPTAVRDRYLAWDIRQTISAPESANADVLTDLQRGVSSVEIVMAGAGQAGGLAPSDLAGALSGVVLDLAPVGLSPGGDGIGAARALEAVYRAAGVDPDRARPVFNLDPLSAWMAQGAAPAAIENALDEAAAFAGEAGQRWPHALCLAASGRVAHEAGATAAQELAVMLAGGVCGLRAMERAGLTMDEALKRIHVILSAGPDVISETAKLRAARLLWSRVGEAIGARPAAMSLQAVTSQRSMTRDDAWTNILRGTAGCFAAAVGGADVITVTPFTAALGAPSALARRMARNTQLILMEESQLGRVADPGGGAWAIEAMTRAIAEAAWAYFQQIEAGGGLISALRDGRVQRDIAGADVAAMKDVARRKQTITGVTDFPLLDETTPAYVAAAPMGAMGYGEDPITALSPKRLSEPFERLRDRAKAASEKAFCATLGPLSEFAPRANFAANLLAAGGIAMLGADAAYGDEKAMIAAFQASSCAVAVLCGSDAAYAAQAGPISQALKQAGAAWVVYAGKPSDEAGLRMAGVDQFIFAGQDALDALATLHKAAGISQ